MADHSTGTRVGASDWGSAALLADLEELDAKRDLSASFIVQAAVGTKAAAV